MTSIATRLPSCRLRQPLDGVQLGARRLGHRIEFEVPIEADGVDHQRVAFPATCRVPHVAALEVLGVLGVHPDATRHPRLFEADGDFIVGLKDDDRALNHGHRGRAAGPAGRPGRAQDLAVLGGRRVAVGQLLCLGQFGGAADKHEEPFGFPDSAEIARVGAAVIGRHCRCGETPGQQCCSREPAGAAS